MFLKAKDWHGVVAAATSSVRGAAILALTAPFFKKGVCTVGGTLLDDAGGVLGPGSNVCSNKRTQHKQRVKRYSCRCRPFFNFAKHAFLIISNLDVDVKHLFIISLDDHHISYQNQVYSHFFIRINHIGAR